MLDELEVIRIAVRTTLAAIGVTVACIVVLTLMAAVVSPSINIPGVSLPGIVGSPSGD